MKMKDYNKATVKVLNIFESTRNYNSSFVEYQDFKTNEIVILKMENFIRRFKIENFLTKKLKLQEIHTKGKNRE